MQPKAESQTTLTRTRSTTEIRNPPWWHRRSRLERLLTILVVVLAVFAVVCIAGMAAILILHREGLFSDYGSSKDLCTTPTCVETAAAVLRDMNPAVDPCEDFYEFACGGFVEKKVIPDDKDRINQFSIIDDGLKNKLRALVEEESKYTEPRPFTMVKNFFRSCVNITKVEELGYKPLTDTLDKIGGWPVVVGPSWDSNNFSWYRSIYENREIGYSIDLFFKFSVKTDFKNSTWRIIDINEASLFMPREYLIKGFDDTYVQAYYRYMVQMAVLLGADEKEARDQLKESLLFEITLANYSLSAEERWDPAIVYNKMTIGNLAAMAPHVPWLSYINKLLEPVNIQVDLEEKINVVVPDFVKKTDALITKTPARVLANYFMWRVVASAVPLLPEEARNIQMAYSAKLKGQQARKPRWEECLDTVRKNLGNGIGSMYVRKHFNENARKDVLEIAAKIHEEFDQILQEIDWMDEVTRARAMTKSKAMTYRIAYPPELLNDSIIANAYKGLELDGIHYFENFLHITKYNTDYAFKRLRAKIDKNDWEWYEHPAVVEALYNFVENNIQLTAGLLQGTFYGQGRPNYMNYGAIGYVIGHEITHGFDHYGRKFDAKGNFSDWWLPETEDRFLQKVQCIIDQYSNITVPEVSLNLNGKLTQGENIADNGGVKEAYRAYLTYAKHHDEEKRLPGLSKFSPRQMFWISSANSVCRKKRPEMLRKFLLTDPHSPGRYRVNIPFGNIEYFAQDFNCKPKAHRCTVW